MLNEVLIEGEICQDSLALDRAVKGTSGFELAIIGPDYIDFCGIV